MMASAFRIEADQQDLLFCPPLFPFVRQSLVHVGRQTTLCRPLLMRFDSLVSFSCMPHSPMSPVLPGSGDPAREYRAQENLEPDHMVRRNSPKGLFCFPVEVGSRW